MSKKPDPKFILHTRLRSAFEFQGKRIAEFSETLGDGGGTIDPQALAGAIALSFLQELQQFAWHGALTAQDIEVAYQAALEASGLEESHTPMGYPIFKRKETSDAEA